MKKSLLAAFLFTASLSVVKAQAIKIDTSVYTSVEQLPEFPGGAEKFKDYVSVGIKKSPLKAPAIGLIIVTFVIEKSGGITDTHITKGLTSEADSIALDIVSKSPKWKPALQNGKAVRCKYSVPISFGKGNSFPVAVKELKD